MSRIKVNEISTLTGTDITIETGKTLTGTASQFKITGGTAGQALITDGSGGISFGAVDSLPTQSGNADKFLKTDGTTATWETVSHDPTMAGDLTGTASNAQIAAGAVSGTEVAATFDISSKTVTLPAASVTAHVTQTDTSVIENNIALLAFKLSTANSLTTFQMVDQVIDEFVDASGIDGTMSTDEQLISGYYNSGAQTSTAAGWIFGASASGVAFGTNIGTADNNGGLAAAFDNTTNYTSSTCAYGPTTSWVGKDAGVNNSIAGTNWTARGASDHGWNNTANGSSTQRLQTSPDGTNWTDVQTFTTSGIPGTGGTTFTETGYFRYWRVWASAQSGGDFRCSDFSLYGIVKTESFNPGMSLVSNTTTAETTPTTGDIVMLMEDGLGTATLNTDVMAYISRDAGSTWSSAVTLVNEGSWGTNKKILVARNVDISSLAGTTSMRWKVELANQVANTVETRIHAMSLAWS